MLTSEVPETHDHGHPTSQPIISGKRQKIKNIQEGGISPNRNKKNQEPGDHVRDKVRHKNITLETPWCHKSAGVSQVQTSVLINASYFLSLMKT